jgi:hypothetical protein
MKHLLNDLTEQEKNSIREQYKGGMNVKPLIEQLNPQQTSIKSSDVVQSGQTPSGNIDIKSFEDPNLPECIDFLSNGASPELRTNYDKDSFPRVLPFIDDVSIKVSPPSPKRYIYMSKNNKAFCKTQIQFK